MAASSSPPDLVLHAAELLAPLGAVRVNRMFGGWGLYVDEIFIAIVAWERLFLKVNAETRPRFEAAGCEPFQYGRDEKRIALGYWSAPADAMESPALMLPWARLALQAALAARAAQAPKAPKAPRAPRAPKTLKPRAPKAPTTKTSAKATTKPGAKSPRARRG